MRFAKTDPTRLQPFWLKVRYSRCVGHMTVSTRYAHWHSFSMYELDSCVNVSVVARPSLIFCLFASLSGNHFWRSLLAKQQNAGFCRPSVNRKSISTQAPPTPRGTKWVIVLDMTSLRSRNESANKIMEMRNRDYRVTSMTFAFWAIRSGLAHRSCRRAAIPQQINLRNASIYLFKGGHISEQNCKRTSLPSCTKLCGRLGSGSSAELSTLWKTS